jgi:hypothetical protein
MFRLGIKFMALLVVLALAAPFILKRPDGRPLMTLDQLHLPRLPSLPALPSLSSQPPTVENAGALAGLPAHDTDGSEVAQPEGFSSSQGFVPDPARPVAAQPGIFYRYRDDNGSWTWADTPKPGVTNFRVMTDSKANILPSLGKAGIDRALGRNLPDESASGNRPVIIGGDEDGSGETKGPLDSLGLTTVPMKELPGLIQQVKDVRTQAEQRDQTLRSMSGE